MSYIVNFERIGRNRSVEPLTVQSDDPDTIAEAIYKYARPKLASKDVEVTVNLEKLTGIIEVGWNNGGTFTLEKVA